MPYIPDLTSSLCISILPLNHHPFSWHHHPCNISFDVEVCHYTPNQPYTVYPIPDQSTSTTNVRVVASYLDVLDDGNVCPSKGAGDSFQFVNLYRPLCNCIICPLFVPGYASSCLVQPITRFIPVPSPSAVHLAACVATIKRRYCSPWYHQLQFHHRDCPVSVLTQDLPSPPIGTNPIHPYYIHVIAIVVFSFKEGSLRNISRPCRASVNQFTIYTHKVRRNPLFLFLAVLFSRDHTTPQLAKAGPICVLNPGWFAPLHSDDRLALALAPALSLVRPRPPAVVLMVICIVGWGYSSHSIGFVLPALNPYSPIRIWGQWCNVYRPGRSIDLSPCPRLMLTCRNDVDVGHSHGMCRFVLLVAADGGGVGGGEVQGASPPNMNGKAVMGLESSAVPPCANSNIYGPGLKLMII